MYSEVLTIVWFIVVTWLVGADVMELHVLAAVVLVFVIYIVNIERKKEKN